MKKDLDIDFNGVIYNSKRDFRELLEENYSDNNLLNAIFKTVASIDGDYAFYISDGENNALVRDFVGVKPLYYTKNNYSFSRLSSDYETLKPGYIIFNGKQIELPKKKFNLNESLEDLIKESVYKRVNDLDDIAVIFSGGVDSSLIALLLKDYPVTLYAVGRENSKDLEYAEKVADSLDLPLKTRIVTEDIVSDSLLDVAGAIGENNLMKIGVGMTIYLACEMIAEDGFSVALSGQGADELFAGYNRYLRTFEDGTLQEELEYDIANMYHVNLERDYAVSKLNNVSIRLPYLDEKLINYALNIPVDEKIYSKDDKIRKRVLRNLALDLGLNEEYAMRPKKAAQYGTGIDKLLRRKVLKKFDLDSYLSNF